MSRNVEFGRTRKHTPLFCFECGDKAANNEAHALNGYIFCNDCFKKKKDEKIKGIRP